ncbi:MAG: LptF/LptG family permease [Ignavibacteriaceae bacterium]|nr:LptF/LptG family permease [Ignavibacteriaceae bacterium]
MILYKYILKNHFLPFIFSIISLMFVFLLQFMMKFADRLIGKGLDTWIILKLIAFNLAWMLVLVVPMATLVATLMAFGNMSQNNEVTILKASGVSLYRIIIAPILGGFVVGYLLLLFNNDVLPDANHQAKVLMQDISRQKPTLSLEPGVFSQEVSNYAILVRAIDKKTNELTDVTIYDYTNPNKVNVVTAHHGRIYFSKDQTKLLMDLRDGEIHESGVGQTNLYRKIIFDKHRIAMDADQFSFQQSAPGGQRGDRELSTHAMSMIVDSLKIDRAVYDKGLMEATNKYFYVNSEYTNSIPVVANIYTKDLILTRAIEKIQTAKIAVLFNYNRIEEKQKQIDRYDVEINKKYALPAACVIFILLGAPLGVMVRKGGFGMAASISLFFFVIYWAFLIGGEKLADRDMLSPFWGMWSANVFLGILGLILLIKAAKEAVIIKFDFILKLIPKQWRELGQNTDESNQ